MFFKLTANRRLYRILFILWSILLFTLTSYPKLSSPPIGITSFDKFAHFFFYFVFALFFVKMHDPLALKSTLNKTLIIALVVPLADELHQIPIPGRDFSIWDIAADLLGISLILIIFRYRLKKLR
ncbi:MAG: VanZ family protein [Candidatus Cloacimonadales bacterium]|nr:VanZ family protein [Candidatus Cloacimonadales bacterium]